ncbi:uncharacterized protein APUU_30328A [Aspergillus puulaauensis]|uniref:Uncharacterized protein n=1 Tax=Aspergillus puulaauensis TaxID=1220207 RepID=A0A7R7XIE3_9EURO|nr:uncharacterized protein APUU_30328A [Aspergillus puulaauensis]BCS22102.1 hypothetical protein APUU_30328A [Aspergillus puulaauensis]
MYFFWRVGRIFSVCPKLSKISGERWVGDTRPQVCELGADRVSACRFSHTLFPLSEPSASDSRSYMRKKETQIFFDIFLRFYAFTARDESPAGNERGVDRAGDGKESRGEGNDID